MGVCVCVLCAHVCVRAQQGERATGEGGGGGDVVELFIASQC